MEKGKKILMLNYEFMKPSDWIDPRTSKWTRYNHGEKKEPILYSGKTGLIHFSGWFPSKMFVSPYRENLGIQRNELVAGRDMPGLEEDKQRYFQVLRDLDQCLTDEKYSVSVVNRILKRVRCYRGHETVTDDDLMFFFEFASPAFVHLLNRKGHDPWFLVQ